MDLGYIRIYIERVIDSIIVGRIRVIILRNS